MKNALLKDTLRDITKSFGRFMSILIIAALGVAFFTGVKVGPTDMEYTADKYYDDYNLMDIRILSTLGLTKDDVESLKSIENIEGIFGTYSMDVLTTYNAKELVLKVHGLPKDMSQDNNDYINRVRVIEGRLPEKLEECVIENTKISSLGVNIGDKLTLKSGTTTELGESLDTTEYEIVGIVESPFYLSYEKGSSSIGAGSVDSYILVPQENFKSDVFTEIFLTVNGAKELQSYSDKYFDLIDNVVKDVEEASNGRVEARYNEVLADAKEELNKGKEEFETKKKEVEDELELSLNTIETSKSDLEKAEKELANKKAEFNSTMKAADDAITKGEQELANGQSQYEVALKEFNEKKALAEIGFAEAESNINEAEAGIGLLQNKVQTIKELLANPELSEEEKIALENELKTNEQILASSQEQVEKAKNEIQVGKDELAKGEQQLSATKNTLVTSKAALESKKNELESGKKTALAEFKKGESQIAEGKEALEQGEKDYAEGKQKADEELSKAEKDLQKAEEEINNIEVPEWYVLDRNKHYSFVDYGSAADGIKAIGNVFPIFFFLVAALVCSTTMTRMVDEQRINIGTLKALGYGKVAIASKYIIYALLASIVGSILGMAIGFTVFPSVIMDAYSIMYSLPEHLKVFHVPYAITGTLVAVAVTTLSAVLAVQKELIEVPSMLMRPRPPKNGKRILFERVPFIWNRLNFTSKVTVRNIFRYKKRFLMTVFGIAGCTALLVTGFGIKDSISTIVEKQFGEIYNYDMSINVEDNISESTLKSLESYITSDNRITQYKFINTENGKTLNKDTEISTTIFVPENIDTIKNFIVFRDRKSKESVSFPENGVILTEKLATKLGVKVGDDIEVINNFDKRGSAKVAAVTENYTFHYVYMSEKYYNEIFNKDINFNTIIATVPDDALDDEAKISTDIMAIDGVSGVKFNSEIRNSFASTIDSLNYVVLLMIVSAGALAFVVLYNLTNVNISERIREVATIKVLGFYDKEVSAYIYRENTILTFIGTIVGLGLGVLLHRFIMVTVEMDNIMFGRNISTTSFVLAGVLTIFFAVLVNIAMHYKLKKIHMVESLKSVD